MSEPLLDSTADSQLPKHITGRNLSRNKEKGRAWVGEQWKNYGKTNGGFWIRLVTEEGKVMLGRVKLNL